MCRESTDLVDLVTAEYIVEEVKKNGDAAASPIVRDCVVMLAPAGGISGRKTVAVCGCCRNGRHV